MNFDFTQIPEEPLEVTQAKLIRQLEKDLDFWRCGCIIGWTLAVCLFLGCLLVRIWGAIWGAS